MSIEGWMLYSRSCGLRPSGIAAQLLLQPLHDLLPVTANKV